MTRRWDMQLKVINVLDPLYHKKDREEATAWKLHSALFACLHEFYVGWPSVKENWRMKHGPTTEAIFSSAESGACAIHIARQFDGEKLKLPLTKPNILKTKNDALHEFLKLRGNFSELSHKALWKVLAGSDFAFDD